MNKLKPFATHLGLVALAVILILRALEPALAITKFNVQAASRFVPGKGPTYLHNAYYRHTKEG